RASAHTEATAAARSAAVSCCAATALPGGDAIPATARHARSLYRVFTRLIYLLLFMAPQGLIYLYLRERLPDPTRPRQAHLVRVVLAGVFIGFNLPWLVVGQRVLFGGSMWGVGRIPFTGPWIAWQHVGRGPHPVHGPVDRVAAVGVDLLCARHAVRPRQGERSREQGAGSGTLWCKERRGASGRTAPCSGPPALSSPLPRPCDLCLRRCRRRPVNLRHLERLSPSSGNPSLARVSRSPTGARRPQAASPLRSARRPAPRRGRDAGDRGAGERA